VARLAPEANHTLEQTTKGEANQRAQPAKQQRTDLDGALRVPDVHITLQLLLVPSGLRSVCGAHGQQLPTALLAVHGLALQAAVNQARSQMPLQMMYCHDVLLFLQHNAAAATICSQLYNTFSHADVSKARPAQSVTKSARCRASSTSPMPASSFTHVLQSQLITQETCSHHTQDRPDSTALCRTARQHQAAATCSSLSPAKGSPHASQTHAPALS